MKVVFLQRQPQGAQVSIERLFDGIRRHFGVGVEWVVHVCPFPSQGWWGRLVNCLEARRSCREGVCHITGDVHYLALALPGRRTVLTIHDCGVLHRLKGWRRWLVQRLWFVWPVGRAAVVTTISNATRADLRRWLPSDFHGKIQVVPNSVRDEFQPDLKEFCEEYPVFLQVGTGWNKNLGRVAEALKGLKCRLEVVGRLSADQLELLKREGIDFCELGRLDDAELVAAYRRCDALIFASIFEGFGLPVLEAQATGRVVISGDCDALREAGGDGALFVDAMSVSAIREGVMEVIRDAELRKRLVEAGFRNVQRFQEAAIAEQYLGIYRGLAGRRA